MKISEDSVQSEKQYAVQLKPAPLKINLVSASTQLNLT